MKQKKISTSLKQRHQIARKSRELYIEKFGDKDLPSYSTFFSNNNPIAKQIVQYEVSYQVSYRGNIDSLLSNPQTFTVYGFTGQKDAIRQRAMNMVLDSKGKISGSNFNNGTLQAIEGNFDVKIEEDNIGTSYALPRGMEETKKSISQEDLNKILEKQFYVKDLDTTFKFKNKKGREGEMDLDISHFL